MSGEIVLILVLVLAVIVLFGALAVALISVKQSAQVAREALEVARHQSDLIAAGDPLAFQAIAAMSQPTVYDGDSSANESEIISGSAAEPRFDVEGFGDDPFISGEIFAPSVGRD